MNNNTRHFPGCERLVHSPLVELEESPISAVVDDHEEIIVALSPVSLDPYNGLLASDFSIKTQIENGVNLKEISPKALSGMKGLDSIKKQTSTFINALSTKLNEVSK